MLNKIATDCCRSSFIKSNRNLPKSRTSVISTSKVSAKSHLASWLRPVGSDARTVNKMLKFSVPPGYWRWKPPVKPKLGPFIAIMDAILAEDKSRSKK